jgi:hypothetical protein
LEFVGRQTLEEDSWTIGAAASCFVQRARRAAGEEPSSSNDEFGLIQDNLSAQVPKGDPYLRRAGVDATTAMKIVGTGQNARYNRVEPEDLAAEPVVSGLTTVSACLSVRARSSVG